MFRIYPEHLGALFSEGLRAWYLLCGIDPLLLLVAQ
ncbi:DNA polymerase III subunit delta, partial [Erwinia amylovora]|nr:DNA polymerase III subunit delta [Erwinia amylovora]